MIFTKKINDKLISFIERVDPKIVKKFIIGFYQISNREIDNRYILDMELIDSHKLQMKIISFLEGMDSLNHEISNTKPTEEIAFFLTHMGHLYGSLIMIDQAIPFYKESIKIRENYLNIESVESAENYLGLGSIYEQGAFFDDALPCYKKALEIRKEYSYVENNLLVAESYSRLGLLYYHMTQYSLALNCLSETIRIREKLLPPKHALLDASYYNYQNIESMAQPKQEYLKILVTPVFIGIRALINRIVGQK